LLVIWKMTETSGNPLTNKVKICLEVDCGDGKGVERMQMNSGSARKGIIVGELALEEFLPKTYNSRASNSVIFDFPDNSNCISEKELDGWNLTCNVYQPSRFNKFTNYGTEEIKSVILGSEGDICIGFFSLVKMWNIPMNDGK